MSVNWLDITPNPASTRLPRLLLEIFCFVVSPRPRQDTDGMAPCRWERAQGSKFGTEDIGRLPYPYRLLTLEKKIVASNCFDAMVLGVLVWALMASLIPAISMRCSVATGLLGSGKPPTALRTHWPAFAPLCWLLAAAKSQLWRRPVVRWHP